jgi:hypothetical protein
VRSYSLDRRLAAPTGSVVSGDPTAVYESLTGADNNLLYLDDQRHWNVMLAKGTFELDYMFAQPLQAIR